MRVDTWLQQPMLRVAGLIRSAQLMHDSFTYIISIRLLCWGWWRRSVPSWRNSSCSGSEKSSSPTHWPSGGKDSPGSWRPSWYTNSNWPGCDSSPSPASKRGKLAIVIISLPGHGSHAFTPQENQHSILL